MINKLLATDFSKLRSTSATWIITIGPLVITGLVFLIFFSKWNDPLPAGINPYDKFLSTGWSASATFLIPLFVVFINSLILNIEHSNEGWKNLLTAPVSKFSMYTSKWLNINIMNLLMHVVYVAFLLMFVYLFAALKPDVGFAGKSPDFEILMMRSLKIFIGTLGLSSIQFVLALWLKNKFKSVGIGMLAVIMGVMLLQWEHVEFFPYAYPALSFRQFDPGNMELLKHEYLSLAWMVFAFTAGWFLWRRKQFR